ncbi:DUF2971 domain-containing protein [Cryobacterium sp. TMT1-2-2]|uniref:DUF2971 domain-containing protein n=1 Tax=Cryobacterium sp. TMT1-2-2 TaxID=1259233 RepID=UPI00106AEF67|nr:DUF2971 domain-containing protein [Cryobacterium sp. TMT1-2-2]TFD13523.1 DUF2971 domain-containing protein [Cryobacterium sp. TMT1-2-2]
MDLGVAIPIPEIGPTLFHYTNAQGLIGIVQNRELWATETNFLNDPAEVTFASAVLVSLLKERALDASENERSTISATIALLEKSYVDPNTPDQYREDRTFITSFSRSDQSLTLWRMYGRQNGFSIGFDEERLLEWIGQGFPSPSDREEADLGETERLDALVENYHLEARIQDVSYRAAHVESILHDVMQVSLDDPNLDLRESLVREVLKTLSAVKHDAYADEKEARMLVQAQHNASDPSIRASASGSLVACRKVVFPFAALRSITIAPGANASQTRHALGSL